jgi:hypothetical protein
VREHSTPSPETQNSPWSAEQVRNLHRALPARYRVATELAAHITAFPPLKIRLPWETPDGEPTTARLVSGIEPSRANGMHALRHFYASVLFGCG